MMAALAAAILYPDNAETRSARVSRALVSLFVFSAIPALAGAVPLGLPASWPQALVGGFVLLFALGLIPFSIFERVAGLFRPRRTLRWACVSVSIYLGWSVICYLLFAPLPLDPQTWIIPAAYGAAGLASGFVWYVMLDRTERNLVALFE